MLDARRVQERVAWGSGLGGAVPEPSTTRLLGHLASVHQRHRVDDTEISAAAAVQWILSKLDAAEATWAAAAAAGKSGEPLEIIREQLRPSSPGIQVKRNRKL